MTLSLPIDDRIRTLVDAGTTGLARHSFASPTLNEQRLKYTTRNASLMAAGVDGDDKPTDEETGVKFRLNQTGNIFYSTTSDVLQEDTKKLFDSVTVLFAAMTKALADKGKSLFDYDAWSSMIGKSGYFVEVQKFERNLVIEKNSLTIDTQIVQQLIPGLVSGNSLLIATSVLNAINGEYKSEKMTDSSKLGHLLFICEELFGSPSITVRLFFATKSSHTAITASPCHKTASTKIEQTQQANTFLFVSPETIAKFAGQFSETPDAFTDLITRLSGYIEG